MPQSIFFKGTPRNLSRRFSHARKIFPCSGKQKHLVIQGRTIYVLYLLVIHRTVNILPYQPGVDQCRLSSKAVDCLLLKSPNENQIRTCRVIGDVGDIMYFHLLPLFERAGPSAIGFPTQVNVPY